MKKLILSFFVIFITAQFSYAQWASSGNNIYNSNIGNVGIGTAAPLTRLHIVGNGSSIDGGNSYRLNGDGLAIQANTGGRTTTTGAQLEFVIPADTNGTNVWGQARIITIAGNSFNHNATGEMILGTRRSFNKLGTGNQWYYGNDLTIDGHGYVGVNTTNTYGYMFAVNGTAIATSMTVKLYNTWPDYVFKPNYTLLSLNTLKTYIDQNHHLPNIPTAAEVYKNGLNLGEMDKALVKKVEELTLYLIDKDEQINSDENKLKAQADENNLMKKRLDLLEQEVRLLKQQTDSINKLLNVNNAK